MLLNFCNFISGKREKIRVLCFVILFFLLTSCATTPPDIDPQKGTTFMTEEEEIKFGYFVDNSITNQFLVVENERMNKRLEEIGRSITKRSGRPDLKYTFRILNDSMVNAFAGPGGFIYVTTGLMEKLKSQDELAAVIAHEIGHVEGRHTVRALRNAQLAQGFLNVLDIGAILTTIAIGSSAPADLTRAIGFITTTIIYQGYSRSFESQADRLGIRSMYKAGYNPQAMINVFETFINLAKEKKEEGPPTILASHPATQDRINEIKEIIEKERLK